MNKVKDFYKKNKKLVLGIGIVSIVVICAGVIVYMNREEVKQVSTDYDVNVNTEVETDISKYLEGVKNPNKVEVDWKQVDTKKIGTYDVILKYKGNEYKVTFHVRDMDSPTLKLSKKEFEFTLDTSLEDVNKTINESVKITDNYDKKFEPIKVVSELPKEIGEQTYNISVKDQAGNESIKEQIKVNYTEPPVEEEPVEPAYETGTQGGTTAQGGYTPHAPVNNTPAPTPEPQAPATPTPEPQAPEEQPTPTEEFTFPSNALETYTTTSKEDSMNWQRSMIKEKYGSSHTATCQGNSDNSVWYCYVQ